MFEELMQLLIDTPYANNINDSNFYILDGGTSGSLACFMCFCLGWEMLLSKIRKHFSMTKSTTIKKKIVHIKNKS